MKTLIWLLIPVLLISCSKDNYEVSYFSIFGIRTNVNKVTLSAVPYTSQQQLQAVDTTIAKIMTIRFEGVPKKVGEYKVVSVPTKEYECSISYGTIGLYGWESSESNSIDNQTAKVHIMNGKIIISFQGLFLRGNLNSTAQVSAYLVQD